MERFFSCDWGTSSFRLKLVETKNFRIIAEEMNNQGILKTFDLWKQSKGADENRSSVYCGIIANNISALEEKLTISLTGLPVIVSGMASSNIGILELPYKEFPFAIDGSDLYTRKIMASQNFDHDLTIISGARTGDDVMRGEETQLAGCDHLSEKKEIFIFPGTHSKHVFTEKGMAIDLKTYMTGEFFELLSKKSILSSSIEKNKNATPEQESKNFAEGVRDSVQSNLLSGSFRIRINSLLNKKSPGENYHYLSGLLIGTELKDLLNNDEAGITIVADTAHSSHYEKAFQILSSDKKFSSPKIQDAEEASIKGQLRIYNFHH